MKKVFSILLVAVCCLALATPAQAQLLKWGVKGGVNMTKIDFDEGYKDKMAGFFIGPMAEVTIPVVGLGMDAALLFSQKGIKADNGTLKQFGIDIPVNLKYTLGLVNLHGKSDAFAAQEIYANLTAFNFASRICREAIVRQPKEGVYAYKVNFKMAVALCREFIRTPKADVDKLLDEIARYTVPIRPGRQDQRDLRVKGFPGFVYRVAA